MAELCLDIILSSEVLIVVLVLVVVVVVDTSTSSTRRTTRTSTNSVTTPPLLVVVAQIITSYYYLRNSWGIVTSNAQFRGNATDPWKSQRYEFPPVAIFEDESIQFHTVLFSISSRVYSRNGR